MGVLIILVSIVDCPGNVKFHLLRLGDFLLRAGQVRAKYVAHAQAAFVEIAPALSELSGIAIDLRSIEEAELLTTELWRLHPNCRATWNWRQLMRKFHRTPKRMDVSFYCGDVLCGLMIATISKTRVNVNIVYVEASPDPQHPLKSVFLPVALYQAELFAATLGATHVSVSNPLPGVIDLYLDLAYERISNDRKRMRRGSPPRDKLLVKAVSVPQSL